MLLSLVLIKGAFEMVSKTTSAVAWDEECLQAGGVLKVCSSAHQTPEFVGKNGSVKGKKVRKYLSITHAPLLV